MDKLIEIIASLTPLITLLVGTGLVAKYAPFLQKLPNAVIPFLNAIIAFLAAFGPATAHAGIFGDLGHALSMPAKLIGSLAVSAIASAVYETFLRHPLEKLGVVKP